MAPPVPKLGIVYSGMLYNARPTIHKFHSTSRISLQITSLNLSRKAHCLIIDRFHVFLANCWEI